MPRLSIFNLTCERDTVMHKRTFIAGAIAMMLALLGTAYAAEGSDNHHTPFDSNQYKLNAKKQSNNESCPPKCGPIGSPATIPQVPQNAQMKEKPLKGKVVAVGSGLAPSTTNDTASVPLEDRLTIKTKSAPPRVDTQPSALLPPRDKDKPFRKESTDGRNQSTAALPADTVPVTAPNKIVIKTNSSPPVATPIGVNEPGVNRAASSDGNGANVPVIRGSGLGHVLRKGDLDVKFEGKDKLKGETDDEATGRRAGKS
jgi:hypothetical protein